MAESIECEFVRWSDTCDSLASFVKFNPSTPKLFLDGQVVRFERLECVTDSACEKAQPGTVVKIDTTFLYVTAADGIIKLGDFSDENDQVITAQMLANKHNICQGEQLPILTCDQAEWLTMANSKSIHANLYWSQRFAKLETSQRLYVQNDPNGPATWAITNFKTISNNISTIDVIAAWLIYIVRDIGKNNLQIGWDAKEFLCHDEETWSSLSPKCVFGEAVPFTIFIDVNDTFSDIKICVEKYYEYLQCLPIALIRQATRTSSIGKISWTLGISLIGIQTEQVHFTSDNSKLAVYVHGSLMTLQINKQGGSFRWIYDQNQISAQEVDRITSRLLVLLTSANNEYNTRKSVAKLNLLPKAERNLLLYMWNQTIATHTHNLVVFITYSKRRWNETD